MSAYPIGRAARAYAAATSPRPAGDSPSGRIVVGSIGSRVVRRPADGMVLVDDAGIAHRPQRFSDAPPPCWPDYRLGVCARVHVAAHDGSWCSAPECWGAET